MREAGVDISTQQSTIVNGEMLEKTDLVVTVCGHADEQCPVLPAGTSKLHWPLDDPAKAVGSEEEIMRQFRISRDDIERRVLDILGNPGTVSGWSCVCSTSRPGAST